MTFGEVVFCTKYKQVSCRGEEGCSRGMMTMGGVSVGVKVYHVAFAADPVHANSNADAELASVLSHED